MSLETAHLSLRPCVPAHMLTLSEQPDRFEQVAGEAAAALVDFAFATPLVALVRAHTLPAANASTHVLAKCAFHHVGTVVDPDDGPVWRWERGR